MATKEKTLEDAFYETLKDVYFAEKKSVQACKKSAKAAQAPELAWLVAETPLPPSISGQTSRPP